MPASIQASAISHIALCVRDLERSLQFYRDGLGFQVTKDEVQDTSRGGLPHLYHDRHIRRRVVHLRYGDAQSVPFLVLTEHPGDTVSGTPIMLDQVGISHVSFTVPNVEEVTQRLLAHGGPNLWSSRCISRCAWAHSHSVFPRPGWHPGAVR